ncbi:hypothetical protein [Flindersiella endophytica]
MPDHASADTPAQPNPALDVLTAGVDSFAAFLQDSGELHDPVFDRPTQYGTAYHTLGNAALAALGKPEARELYLDRATIGLDASLAHTGNPALPAAASGFDRATGVTTAGNHRDFTWPPILKAYRVLAALGSPRSDEFAERIAAVPIMDSFRSRPPSNWSSVWLSGEWIRIKEGLSRFTLADIDGWLEVFFEQLVYVELGFYAEPGLPNSYDLFTRYHFADLLAEGYHGRFAEPMRRLLETGLERSLAVQLSDGSLASAHRSCGQTWTLGGQIAYFTHVLSLLGDHRAGEGADRAFASMRRFQRPDGPFSPVENVLPPTYRVGYERYTADGHYSNLALGFLAVAVMGGFTGDGEVPDERPASVRIEAEPTWRAVLSAGRYSAALNAAPAEKYDAFGLTDLTFGQGRVLQFASSARFLGSDRFLNVGLDVGPLTRTGPIEPVGETGARVAATAEDGRAYEQTVAVSPEGIEVWESLPGAQALLVPYLRDPGTGTTTTAERDGSTVVLRNGSEQVRISVDAEIATMIVLENGFENRRGLCGLLRLELATPADTVSYRIS